MKVVLVRKLDAKTLKPMRQFLFELKKSLIEQLIKSLIVNIATGFIVTLHFIITLAFIHKHVRLLIIINMCRLEIRVATSLRQV